MCYTKVYSFGNKNKKVSENTEVSDFESDCKHLINSIQLGVARCDIACKGESDISLLVSNPHYHKKLILESIIRRLSLIKDSDSFYTTFYSALKEDCEALSNAYEVVDSPDLRVTLMGQIFGYEMVIVELENLRR